MKSGRKEGMDYLKFPITWLTQFQKLLLGRKSLFVTSNNNSNLLALNTLESSVKQERQQITCN
jgi:hypothetical protein